MNKVVLAAIVALLGVPSAVAQGVSPEDLSGRQIERRAVEAVIWGMPAVNFELMFQAMIDAGGTANQIVYWSRLPDWKNQTLTPNPSTIYLMPFIDTSVLGPMVLEIPPADGGAITGTIMNAWQEAMEDVGPAGVDQGKGGKYLILPPGYEGEVPDGYIALRSSTNMAYALLRSNVGTGSDADIAKGAAYGRRVKLYPLSEASAPPPTSFTDAIDTVYDATIPYDRRYFQLLDRFVQREPWLERDRAMIDQLKSVGIAKGQAFAPDPATLDGLDRAAAEAGAWLRQRYQTFFTPAYYEDSHWALPVPPAVGEGLSNFFSTPDVYPVDDRGVFFSFAFSSVKHLGSGQFYLVAIRDKGGAPFDGGSTYRLTVPAEAPVNLYWSATVYDAATHALIRDQSRSSRASNTPELKANADGSIDVFFGPSPPVGKETNWIPTRAGAEWEIIFRFYGPEKPLFDKTWVLPDIEKFEG